MLKSKLCHTGAALLLFILSAGCSSSSNTGRSADGGTSTVPTVVSTSPLSAATNVALNVGIAANFSEPMDPATLSGSTFIVTSGPGATPVQGTVIYLNSTGTFWPAAHLASNTSFTANVTTGAKSAAGVALGAAHSWSFNTGTTLVAGFPVNLGTSGSFAILSKSGISTVPTSAITGDIGVSPAAATSITAFDLKADASNVFSISPQVTGKVYASDYKPPTPANLTIAVSDMATAFTDAAGRAPDVTELGAGNIGGQTLAPGVYKWGTGLLIPTDVTLNGSATDVWIFQVAKGLTLSNGTKVKLSGGALPKNIFWQVSGAVELGTTSHFEGIVLAQTAIALRTGASISGRLFAQTAVSLDSSTVVHPAP